jgi:hypothetical protein
VVRTALSGLSDRELLAHLAHLVHRERAVLRDVLLHLAEVEARKLHLKLGYGSLFDYCTRKLGYSESAAGRRIQVARCLRRFPETDELLAQGQVSLVTLAMVAGILTETNKDEILSSIRGQSQREVERIVSAYRPRPFVRDQVRPVSVIVPAGSFSTPSAGSELPTADRVGRTHARPALTQPSTPSAGSTADTPEPDTSTSPVKPHIIQKHVIQFAAGDAFMKKLDEMRVLLSAKMPGASLEQMFEAAMDAYLDRHSQTRRAEARARREEPKRRRLRAGKAKSAPSRHIPASVRAEVFARDGGRCTYVAPEGTRCNSTHALQIDHVRPFARGGPSVASNLRLLCAGHNRLAAENIFGAGFMERF